MPKIQITQNVEISNEMIDDILCAAFEGGINYWCDGIKSNKKDLNCEYSFETISRGGVVRFDVEDEDDYLYLDLEKFLNGVKLFCEKFDRSPYELHEDHDANDADIIVQYALFGEIVYG